MAQIGPQAWSVEENETLLQNVTTLVDTGVWQAGQDELYPATWEILHNHMHIAFLQSGITINYIQGKIKNWRNSYCLITNMLHTPGFDWDPNENRVLVENDEVWNEYVQVNVRATHMRYRQFPNYNRWVHCFGRR